MINAGTEMLDLAQLKYHLSHISLLPHLVPDCTISLGLKCSSIICCEFLSFILVCVSGSCCRDKLTGAFVPSLILQMGLDTGLAL